MKKLWMLIGAVLVFGVAGCNTMAGLGKDTQAAGSALENAAKK
ncbi:entericidin A/B family lipoprotein [Pandoraea pulmonicola]|uniref:Entericidin n=1 Tax=Pandoraea pulmonicola TaxID=93221 RepID=A0AAJ4Z9C8_PANPU|nr:entericidin A/B family lipoprotein [Pandoraea pulmonicola]AJC21941.1 entericidin [Pandoraea pulmonicola]SUA89111.1 Predicted small secreted protein [Pandoraea pulmonicola]